MTRRTARIRALNDELRQNGGGCVLVVTCGLAALPASARVAIIMALLSFDALTPANDPHKEHDLGLFEAAGQRLMLKIDYFDLALSGMSPDPTDPEVTQRMLTIMLPSED